MKLMFEWCYQWEDYNEAVRRYYANPSRVGKTQIEAASKELAEDLWQNVQVVNVKSSEEKRPFHKKPDPKDGVYFINI